MEIKNLITFTKVAESGSLSGAAKLLGYAQSTVTMQMQQLEQELGAPLYERVGKRIRITQAGQGLLSYAVPIIRMSQEALLAGKGAPKAVEGSLRLGVSEALASDMLAGAIDSYARKHPQVELEVRTGDSGVLLNLLRHNEIDLMVALDYRLTDADLIHAGDEAEDIHFLAVPGHPLAETTKPPLERILSYPVISGGCLPCEQELEKEASALEFRQIRVQNLNLALLMAARQSTAQASSEEVAGSMARPATVLAPDSAAQEYVRDGRLKTLDYRFAPGRMWRQTIYHKNKWLTGAMDAWINMTEDEG